MYDLLKGKVNIADMQLLSEIGISEKILIAFLLGWDVAQLSKIIIALVRTKDIKVALGAILRSGGMPSGHSAGMMALVVSLGALDGVRTPLFVVTLAITAIVIYDACNVRYAVGENAKILKDLSNKDVQITEGHTVLQVIVGAVIGVVVGLLVGFL